MALDGVAVRMVAEEAGGNGEDAVKIKKWIDFGQEIEVSIDTNDIGAALSEAFSRVTDDRLGELGPDKRDVLRAINYVASFLVALKNELIQQMSEPQRKLIGSFLAQQAERFGAELTTKDQKPAVEPTSEEASS